MSELTFAKSFLQSLDSKLQKLPADHVYDLKTFSPRIPYTLRPLPHPPHPILYKRTSSKPAPGSEKAEATLVIHLKSARNPPLNISLPEKSATSTTVFDLKEAVRKTLAGDVGVDKIKILLNRRPVSGDSKSVAEVLGDDLGSSTEVEFGVMVMGGGTLKEQPSPSVAPAGDAMEGVQQTEGGAAVMSGQERARAAQGPLPEDVLKSDDFWADLRGFIVQRLKVDEAGAGKVADVWKRAWESGGGKL